MDKKKILIEWHEWELAIKIKGYEPKKVVPNMYELMEKIKKGEIKV
jgi:hypothetical protein